MAMHFVSLSENRVTQEYGSLVRTSRAMDRKAYRPDKDRADRTSQTQEIKIYLIVEMPLD